MLDARDMVFDKYGISGCVGFLAEQLDEERSELRFVSERELERADGNGVAVFDELGDCFESVTRVAGVKIR